MYVLRLWCPYLERWTYLYINLTNNVGICEGELLAEAQDAHQIRITCPLTAIS